MRDVLKRSECTGVLEIFCWTLVFISALVKAQSFIDLEMYSISFTPHEFVAKLLLVVTESFFSSALQIEKSVLLSLDTIAKLKNIDYCL